MKKTSFKELIVWRKSIDLVKEIYKTTEKLPRGEQFILVAQMRRAAISIPCNIAEGKKRKTRLEVLRFLRIADGSAAELETQLTICRELYPNMNFTVISNLLQEVQKMLFAFIQRLMF